MGVGDAGVGGGGCGDVHSEGAVGESGEVSAVVVVVVVEEVSGQGGCTALLLLCILLLLLLLLLLSSSSMGLPSALSVSDSSSHESATGLDLGL